MNLLFFAAESSGGSPLDALGVHLGAFIIQLITFLLVFMILMKFAFRPIVRMLEKRRQTIEDGVKLGLEMEKEREGLRTESANVIRDARHEADRIISNAQKDAREVVREAEKAGQRKVDAMVEDAEARINEETEQARRLLEKDMVGLVAEATEAVVEEKVDAGKDAELIDKAMKGRRK
jgi:F-type H+-transporting ATPase subunit b